MEARGEIGGWSDPGMPGACLNQHGTYDWVPRENLIYISLVLRFYFFPMFQLENKILVYNVRYPEFNEILPSKYQITLGKNLYFDRLGSFK